MYLEIITPEKKVYSGDVEAVKLPGADGSFGIMNNHAPIISTLNDGKLVIRDGGKEDVFFIQGGVVEAINNKVTVLAEGITHK